MTSCGDNGTTGPIRVALVGSEYDVVAQLGARLEVREEIEIVGAFPSGQAALAGLPTMDADVVIVDADVVDGFGPELGAGLRRSGRCPACLVLSGLPQSTVRLGEWTVDAVVLKSLTGDVLEREILRLARLGSRGCDGSRH